MNFQRLIANYNQANSAQQAIDTKSKYLYDMPLHLLMLMHSRNPEHSNSTPSRSRNTRLLVGAILSAASLYVGSTYFRDTRSSSNQANPHSSHSTADRIRVWRPHRSSSAADTSILVGNQEQPLLTGLTDLTGMLPRLQNPQPPISAITSEHNFIDLRVLYEQNQVRNRMLCNIGHQAATDIELYFDQHGGYYSYGDFVRVYQETLDTDYNISDSVDSENPAKSHVTRDCIMREFEGQASELEDAGRTTEARRLWAATGNFSEAISTCDRPENTDEQFAICSLELLYDNMNLVEDTKLVAFFKDTLYFHPEFALNLVEHCTPMQKTAIIQAISELAAQIPQREETTPGREDLSVYQQNAYQSLLNRRARFLTVQAQLVPLSQN